MHPLPRFSRWPLWLLGITLLVLLVGAAAYLLQPTLVNASAPAAG